MATNPTLTPASHRSAAVGEGICEGASKISQNIAMVLNLFTEVVRLHPRTLNFYQV